MLDAATAALAELSDWSTPAIEEALKTALVEGLVDRVQVEERLERQASTDALTGLANRRTFDDQLETARKRLVKAENSLLAFKRRSGSVALSEESSASVGELSALNTGVGLTNTRSRLEELFPGRHRFEFHEPADGGPTTSPPTGSSATRPSSDPPRDPGSRTRVNCSPRPRPSGPRARCVASSPTRRCRPRPDGAPPAPTGRRTSTHSLLFFFPGER